MKKKIILLLISIVVLNCKKSDSLPISFDYGSIENDIYNNTYFKFKLPINPDWYLLNNEEADAVYDLGKDFIAGEDDKLKESLSASDINVAKLVTLFREQPGTNQDFNPSIIINAENLKNFPHVKEAKQYIEEAKKLLDQPSLQIEYLEEDYNVKIGSLDFANMKIKNTMMGIEIFQEYYVAIKNGFALAFIMSYDKEEDKEHLYKMFNKLKI